jgi:hypothetical protein
MLLHPRGHLFPVRPIRPALPELLLVLIVLPVILRLGLELPLLGRLAGIFPLVPGLEPIRGALLLLACVESVLVIIAILIAILLRLSHLLPILILPIPARVRAKAVFPEITGGPNIKPILIPDLPVHTKNPSGGEVLGLRMGPLTFIRQVLHTFQLFPGCAQEKAVAFLARLESVQRQGHIPGSHSQESADGYHRISNAALLEIDDHVIDSSNPFILVIANFHADQITGLVNLLDSALLLALSVGLGAAPVFLAIPRLGMRSEGDGCCQ